MTTTPTNLVEDGGFMLTTDAATWLRDQLTAWLDAPRLAARETPEVVAEFASFQLLRTAFEWGVRWPPDEDPEDDAEAWYPSEVEAREAFRLETETVVCEACGRFVADCLAGVDEDLIYTCPDGAGCNVTPTEGATP